MYTVEIGRQFLKYYNQKTGNDYSALEFFEEEFFSVVFECDDKKQLYPFIHNSSFHQSSYPRIAEKEEMAVCEYRKQRFYEDLELVPKGEIALSHSKLIGAKSGSPSDNPSGQVSDIEMDISKDEMIYSWIGGAFGIAFKGGYDVLIDDDEINWQIFLGWKYYRKFIEQTPNVKARQLTDWNANWIYYGGYAGDLDRSFIETVRGINEDNSRSKNIRIRKIEWSKIIFGMTKFFNKKKRILAYAYKFGFGKTFNRTLGFFPIQFDQIGSWYELFEKHLETEADISGEGWVALTEVYQSEFNLMKAFMRGGIGIQAIRPRGLFKYASKKNLSKWNSTSKKIKFIIFKTWLIAMLNKKEILEISDKLAGKLYQYSTNNKRGKTTKSRDVDKLWEAKNLNTFVDLLTEITEKSDETNIFKEVVNTVVLDLPKDRFRLFITLTKFNYKTY